MTGYEKKIKNKIAGKSYSSTLPGSLLIFMVTVIMAVMFIGCVHSDAAFFSAGGKTFSKTVPDTLKFSNYRVVQIDVTSTIKKSEKLCSKLEDKIIALLKEKQFFKKVLSGDEESQEPPIDLQLISEIVALDKVTALERMFLDGFVGKAKIVVVNRVKDVKTGQELGMFTTGGQSTSGELASIFAAGTTRQALKYTAKQIVKFIQAHM